MNAHAKINLRHRVFAPDDTGFHGVETLLLRTSLHDEVEIERTRAGVSIEVDGPTSSGVPADETNLCCRAAVAFLETAFPRAENRPGVHIRLTKRIPSASGLGGGSADAGATLRLLTGWSPMSDRDLIALSGRLGSDVPFAVLDVPMALGWERGRRLIPLRPPRARPALLVSPSIAVSTPSAYGWLLEERRSSGAPDPGGATVLPGASRLAGWDSLERLARNDLEGPVLARFPELAEALSGLRELEPGCSGMTGSGSTLFAVFPDDRARDAAETATRDLVASDWGVTAVHLPV